MVELSGFESMPANPTAWELYDILANGGLNIKNPEKLIEQIKGLSRGIPAEDEFIALLAWMGKCVLVHRLDQEMFPREAKKDYVVPDLLAFFRYEGHLVPVLIEVKKRRRDMLSWKPTYLAGLRRYASAMGLPLLIAWQWKAGFWALFEDRHFRKAKQNYRISFGDAMRETLMSLLAGDFAVEFEPGVGLHFVMKKEALLKSEGDRESRREIWKMVVSDAFFTNGKGDRLHELGGGLWPLFLCGALEEKTDFGDKKVRLSYVIGDESRAEWSHRMLGTLLRFRAHPSDMPNWRTVLRKGSMPTEFQELNRAAANGIPIGVVRYVMNVTPHTYPGFLPRPTLKTDARE